MKKYSIYIWALVAILYISFIGIMSYWYPVTLDEYFRWGVPFRWEMVTDAYFEMVPRISVFFGIPVFALGKWFFVLLNSLIQFTNCLCIFYILFVRLPNIKNFQDMPYFLTILCMSVFFVSGPSQVLFWLSGALNYTWTILFLLIMLCFLSQIRTGKLVFKDTWLFRIFIFIIGFLVGMSNECLSPIALGATVLFALFREYKKSKSPRALSFLIFGLAIGCLVFFSAPAHYHKMSLEGFSNLAAVSFGQKLFFHINHINKFFASQLYLFVITSLFLIIACLDKDKKGIKRGDLWNSFIFLLLSFIMAFILFVAPSYSLIRVYYPASVLCIVSFLFLVKYYIHAYNFDFSKWLCYIILAISLFLAPRFILPHYSLHLQDDIHNYLQRQPKPIVTAYMVLKGPTDNLSIEFMDPARRFDLGNGMYGTDASPLINW